MFKQKAPSHPLRRGFLLSLLQFAPGEIEKTVILCEKAEKGALLFALGENCVYLYIIRNGNAAAPARTRPMTATPTTARPNRTEKSQGMNWISQHKRLAIYLRDGLACSYCGAGVEEGVKFTLDHLTPYSLGGSNQETNLVTCCLSCNSARGNRDVKSFAEGVAAYKGTEVKAILAGIRNRVRRVLPLAEAKAMVARRGSCAKALAELN